MTSRHPGPLRLALLALTALLALLAFAGPSAAAEPSVRRNDTLDSALSRHYPRHLAGRQKTHKQRRSRTPGTLLFDGQQISDFGLIQAAPEAISEVGDPLGSGEGVLQFTVNDDDVYPLTPTENPRAQAIGPGIIEAGDEFWLKVKFMLPEDLPYIPSWFGLCSVYGAPFDGPSPWSMEINENEFRWQRNSTYDWDIPWRAPLIKGKWVTILSHERFGSDGFIEMWFNGEPVTFFADDEYNFNDEAPTRRLQMQTMDASNYAAPNAPKITQYRKVGMFDSATDYFDYLKMGTTRAAVEAGG